MNEPLVELFLEELSDRRGDGEEIDRIRVAPLVYRALRKGFDDPETGEAADADADLVVGSTAIVEDEELSAIAFENGDRDG